MMPLATYPASSLLGYAPFGINLVGVNKENGKKLLFTVCFIVAMVLLNKILGWVMNKVCYGFGNDRVAFWSRQIIRVVVSLIVIIGLLSIWFDDPTRLATAMGLVTAGVAFALQRVITAIAGYFVILRGKTFNIGDRIVMGGVRGDVVALGFTQTTIMEMGQPPGEQGDEPSMWVKARQYTGRIVTVTNDKIFDTPVYNYTRDFQYLWEEMTLPIAYDVDRAKVEQMLLRAARNHAVVIKDVNDADLREMERRFRVKREDLEPRVYWRMTDNWLELTVRFITLAHGAREIKDAMSRQLLAEMDEAKIGLASTTFAITGLPPVKLQIMRSNGNGAAGHQRINPSEQLHGG